MNLNQFWQRLKSPTFLLSFALVAGLLLRVVFVEDMEYKEDEEYNFTQAQLIGNSQPWPWYGIPSGVYLVNPGMSIWAFTVLAKLFHLTTPTSLAHGVQLFALLGISLILPFVWKFLKEEKDKAVWLWAFALTLVNPFLILYQRKLWPEPFLPFFTMLTLMGWWRRDRKGWSFLWGWMGAWLGQIHMSGFFFSLALMLWTLFFDRKPREQGKTSWTFWFLGSVWGALPLIPWAWYVFQHPVQQSMSSGWNEIIQFKFWSFWITDPTGLHLGNPLGLLRGQSNWDQISDFVRYPILGGVPTYLVGLAHLAAAASVLFIWIKGMRALWRTANARGGTLRSWAGLAIGQSDTAFVQNATLWGCGILLTVTGVVIRRYYMTVTFPLEFILLIRLADPLSRMGKKALVTLWIAELFISASFVGYVHVNEGAPQGDYGDAYHRNMKLRAEKQKGGE